METKAREFQRDSRSVTGVIVRINQRTATIGTGDGGTWRVPFQMLRHVLDISGVGFTVPQPSRGP